MSVAITTSGEGGDPGFRNKQIDHDLCCTTWSLNKFRLRTSDLVVKIEVKDLRAKKDERMGRMDPKKPNMRKPNSKNSCPVQMMATTTYDERNDGLLALQERWEDAAAAVKVTTTAMRNKNEIREMAAEAAKCRDPVSRKSCGRRPVKHAENSTQAEPSCLEARWITGQWLRNSAFMSESARAEMSGQKKLEPIVKSAMMTNPRRQRIVEIV